MTPNFIKKPTSTLVEHLKLNDTILIKQSCQVMGAEIIHSLFDIPLDLYVSTQITVKCLINHVSMPASVFAMKVCTITNEYLVIDTLSFDIHHLFIKVEQAYIFK